MNFTSRFKLLYEVVTESEEPHEELDLKNQLHWEVVEESPCPFLHCSGQVFNTVHRVFANPFEAKDFLGLQDIALSTRITACLCMPPTSGKLQH